MSTCPTKIGKKESECLSQKTTIKTNNIKKSKQLDQKAAAEGKQKGRRRDVLPHLPLLPVNQQQSSILLP